MYHSNVGIREMARVGHVLEDFKGFASWLVTSRASNIAWKIQKISTVLTNIRP